MTKLKFIPGDISWLRFNGRVLQESAYIFKVTKDAEPDIEGDLSTSLPDKRIKKTTL